MQIGIKLCALGALFTAACGTVQNPTVADDTAIGDAGGDAGGDDSPPDAGAPQPDAECAIATDCAAGQSCTAGACVTPPPECVRDADCGAGKQCDAGSCVAECAIDTDCAAGNSCNAGACIAIPLAIQIVPTTIRDERGDTITFTQGEPKHVHAGATVTLGSGTVCPDVFKYGYLLGTAAPVFGSQTTANPLTFRFRANLSAFGDFRVRTASAVILDWTSATTTGSDFVADLRRDGAQRIAELGTTDGDYFIDLRVRDLTREITATACWKHHPLAAPLEMLGLVASTTVGSLSTFTLPADSPLSQLFSGGQPIPIQVFEGRVRQGTAEAVTVKLTIPLPQATFTKLAVDDLATSVVATSIPCGTACGLVFNCVPQPATDPRCTTGAVADPADLTVTGSLVRGTWTATVLEGGQPAGECTVAGLDVTCNLSGRAAGSPARELTVEVFGTDLDDLRPADGPVGEKVFQGVGYTGLAPVTIAQRCTSMARGTQAPDGQRPLTCTQLTTFSEIVALDSLRVSFAPVTFAASTSVPGGLLSIPPYAPNGIPGAAFVWNAGDDDLPGPSH